MGPNQAIHPQTPPRGSQQLNGLCLALGSRGCLLHVCPLPTPPVKLPPLTLHRFLFLSGPPWGSPGLPVSGLGFPPGGPRAVGPAPAPPPLLCPFSSRSRLPLAPRPAQVSWVSGQTYSSQIPRIDLILYCLSVEVLLELLLMIKIFMANKVRLRGIFLEEDGA